MAGRGNNCGSWAGELCGTCLEPQGMLQMRDRQPKCPATSDEVLAQEKGQWRYHGLTDVEKIFYSVKSTREMYLKKKYIYIYYNAAHWRTKNTALKETLYLLHPLDFIPNL